ncbi:ATP-binding protein, partial [Listeria monocytogenes]|nr:ATP-binding protein [Listeria monocytogenes]EEA7503408.1 AAA family ATPase [Listeria monocytogenes]
MNELNFIETKEYKKFAEFCRACMKYKYIGICYGNPGVGKTISAKHYANWHRLETILTRKGNRLNPELVIDKLKGIKTNTLFVTAPATKPSSLSSQLSSLAIDIAHVNEIISSTENKVIPKTDRIDYMATSIDRIVENIFYAVDLIIIDEIDRLKIQTLDLLRDIYDQNDVGMVFIGMQGIEKRLSKYPQLYSRIGFAHEFKKLSSSEIK